MQFHKILAHIALCLPALTAAQTPHYDVVYYPVSDFNCEHQAKAMTLNATVGTCYNLDHPAQAFKLGTAANKQQLSHDARGFGCEINGWADKGCPGENVIYAVPSNLHYAESTKFGACYPSTYSTAIESVQILCGP